MEYKRITSKGGVNIPVKLRRSMGMEPRDAIELEVNDRNELVIRAYQARCIYCGLCEEACPTLAIQMTPDFEICKRDIMDLVYEKEDLLISGPGKYPDYNFYRMTGMAIAGKAKGDAENEAQPIDVKSLLP